MQNILVRRHVRRAARIDIAFVNFSSGGKVGGFGGCSSNECSFVAGLIRSGQRSFLRHSWRLGSKLGFEVGHLGLGGRDILEQPTVAAMVATTCGTFVAGSFRFALSLGGGTLGRGMSFGQHGGLILFLDVRATRQLFRDKCLAYGCHRQFFIGFTGAENGAKNAIFES